MAGLLHQAEVGMATYKLPFLLIAVALSAISPGSAVASELMCDGPFGKGSSHTKLMEAFGSTNVSAETLHGPEGIEFRGSVIFPNDPARRVEVIWWNEKARTRPSTIRVNGTGWTSPVGIRVGAPLSAVEKANGRVFSLNGFGWDYGGASTNWRGGTLANLADGCTLSVTFGLDDNVPEAARTKATGDREFASNAPVIQAVKPKVQEIRLGYPR
jgi:hypothetical protein